jgi:hypothetical protein
MERFLGIELLKHAAGAVEIHDSFLVSLADPAVLGTSLMYLLAFAWLAYRLAPRYRAGCRRHLRHSARAGGGLLRLVGAVVFLAVGLFLAVARSAGRSTFHSGARF